MSTVDEKKELKEVIDQLLVAQQREIDLQAQLNSVAGAGRDITQTQIDAAAAFTTTLRNQVLQLTALNAQMKENEGNARKQQSLRKRFVAILKKETDELAKNEIQNAKQIASNQQLVALLQNESIAVDDIIKGYSKLANSRSGAMGKQALEAAQSLAGSTGQAASNILGIDSNWRNANLTGQFINAVDKGADLSNIFGQMGAGLRDALSPTNLLGSALTKIASATVEMTRTLMGNMASLKEATTAGDEYLPVLSGITNQNLQIGLTSDEAEEALTELLSSMKAFSGFSLQAQSGLAGVVSTLSKFAVTTQEAAQAADILVSSLGMSSQQAKQTMSDFVGLAEAINEPPSVIFANFGRAQQMVAQFGSRGTDEFRRLSAAAKATAVDISSLLQIAGGFDTFGDAADKVGQLNAMLGGAYFDTVTMVNATEQDRIRILMEGVQATGRSWEAMGRFERKAIANAAGIRDLTEANKIFNMSLSAYDELQQLASGASMSLSDLSQEAYNNLSTQQKWEVLLNRLIPVLDELITMLDGAITTVNSWMNSLQQFSENVGLNFKGVVLGISAAFLGLFTRLNPVRGILNAVFGVSRKLFGFFSRIVTGGIIGRLSTAMTGVGTSSRTASAGMAGLALEIAAIGAAITGVIWSTSQLINSFKGLFSTLAAMPEKKLDALAAFMAKMTGLGFVGMPAVAGLAGISLGLTGFSAAMSLVPLKEVEMLGILFGNISSMSSSAANSTTSAISALNKLSSSMKSLPTKELETVGFLFGNIARMSMDSATATAIAIQALNDLSIKDSDGIEKAAILLNSVANVEPESAVAVNGIIKNAIELATAKSDDKLLEFLNKLIYLLPQITQAIEASAASGGAAVGGGGGSSVPLVVNLDGRSVFQGMVPYINDARNPLRA